MISGHFEAELLVATVLTDDQNKVHVYTRNIRTNVIDPFTYRCNVCQCEDITGQDALFEHNKSANHIDHMKWLSGTNEKKMYVSLWQRWCRNFFSFFFFQIVVVYSTDLKNVDTSRLAKFSHCIFDDATLSTIEKAVHKLYILHSCYEKSPDKHPSYASEWVTYYKRRREEILAGQYKSAHLNTFNALVFFCSFLFSFFIWLQFKQNFVTSTSTISLTSGKNTGMSVGRITTLNALFKRLII